MTLELLWYIPNQVQPGHRGDDVIDKHNSLETLSAQAKALEDHGWGGALLGTGWGRPDTFTVAAALAARTTTFQPLIAIRPGYWRPANFASAAATLDHLTGGGCWSTSCPARTTWPRTATKKVTRRIATRAPGSSSGSSADCGPRNG
ncbi:hypothetical protein Jiend_57250 [Micromonospora endophytica]|nr:hypothetical protein Jiend_57250 [Micromonospora endophytica]